MTAAEVAGYLEPLRRAPSTRRSQSWTAGAPPSRRVGDGYRVTTDAATPGAPATWSSPPATATARRPALRRRAAIRPSGRSTPAATATRTSCPTAACSSSAPRRPASQIADELRQAGRDVVLAVGAHTRLPRRYRGMDIMWWLERIGALDRTIDEVPRPPAARREPSLQLRRAARDRDLDLATLQRRAASGWPAGWPAPTGTGCGSPTTCPRPPPRPRRGCDRLLARDRPVHRRRRARAARCCPNRAGPPVAVTARRDARPRSRRHRDGRVGDRLPAPVPVAAGAGARRRRRDPPHRGVTAGPRPVRASACASSTAATPPSSTAPATTPPTSPTTSPSTDRARPTTRPGRSK